MNIQEIEELIECVTGHKYTGKMKVCYDEADEMYLLHLYLNREMIPLTFGKQGTWEEFLQYLSEELRNRKLELIPYWNGIKDSNHITY